MVEEVTHEEIAAAVERYLAAGKKIKILTAKAPKYKKHKSFKELNDEKRTASQLDFTETHSTSEADEIASKIVKDDLDLEVNSYNYYNFVE